MNVEHVHIPHAYAYTYIHTPVFHYVQGHYRNYLVCLESSGRMWLARVASHYIQSTQQQW